MNFDYDDDDNESFIQLYEGSGFGNFLKDQSKKFIKKAASSAVEKAVNTGSTAVGEKFGTLIANKIIPPSKLSETLRGHSRSQDKKTLREHSRSQNQNLYNIPEIPIDSGYKIIKLLQKNPVDDNNIRKQFNSI